MRVLDNEIQIRHAIMRDYGDILRLDAAGYRRPWDVHRLKLHRLKPDGCILVAENAGSEPLGFAAYRLMDRHVGLVRLAVRPDLRRLGIGTRLVRKLLGKLSLRRRDRLVCWVPAYKTEAACFLRSCGLLACSAERGGAEWYRFVYAAQWCQDGDCVGR